MGMGGKDSFSSSGTVDVREELAGVWATKTTTTRTEFRTFEHSDIISLDSDTYDAMLRCDWTPNRSTNADISQVSLSSAKRDIWHVSEELT